MKDSTIILELLEQNLDVLHHQLCNIQDLIERYKDLIDEDKYNEE